MFSKLSIRILSLIVVSLCLIGDEKKYLSANYVDRSEADGNEAFEILTNQRVCVMEQDS